VAGLASHSVLSVSNLTKYYGNFKALDSVSFTVDEGCVYGYLGPNGAGKTTTIRIMLGLLKPNQGEVQIAGANPSKDPVQALRSVGYAAELPVLQAFFTDQKG
jgi:ABC-2 type transport system ATP-binding protein